METTVEQTETLETMPRKRIYNPVTKKYYGVRSKTTKRGRIGQIKGLWGKKKR